MNDAPGTEHPARAQDPRTQAPVAPRAANAANTEDGIVSELPVEGASAEWSEFVAAHEHATFFHELSWRDQVRRHFRHRPRYLIARRAGRVVGVLPLFETRSPLSGRALISCPYAVYGGPLAADPQAERLLLERVRGWIAEEGYRFAELRCLHAPAEALEAHDLYATFLADLPEDPEQCLERIPRKSRATTRQARDKHGLTFREAPDALDRFHELFVTNKRKLGSPAFSRRWFADLLARGRGEVQLHVVERGDEVLAAVMSFVHRDTLNPYYSGSVPEADRLGASNFVYWNLMRVAVEQGLRRFDFGRSRVDTGPFHFKRNMGFEPTPLPYRHLLAAGRAAPEVNPGNPKFSLPRRVLQRLPMSLSQRIGPLLMRWVP